MMSLRPGLAHHGQDRAALWAVLDAQFDDAQRLLTDPDHRSASALERDDIARLDGEGQRRARGALLRGSMLVLAALLVALVLVLNLGR